MLNYLIISVGKQLFPSDEVWEQRRKTESLATVALALLAVIGLMTVYCCMVGRFFMKTGGCI